MGPTGLCRGAVLSTVQVCKWICIYFLFFTTDNINKNVWLFNFHSEVALKIWICNHCRCLMANIDFLKATVSNSINQHTFLHHRDVVFDIAADRTGHELIHYHVEQFIFIWILLTQNFQKAHCTWIHIEKRSLLVSYLETFVVHLPLCKYAGSSCVTWYKPWLSLGTWRKKNPQLVGGLKWSYLNFPNKRRRRCSEHSGFWPEKIQFI